MIESYNPLVSQFDDSEKSSVELRVLDIVIGEQKYPPAEDDINGLVAQIEANGGHIDPITIRWVEGSPVLVHGDDRLEAVKRLGRTHIACVEFRGNDREAEIYKISQIVARRQPRCLTSAILTNRLRELLLKVPQVSVPGGEQPTELGIGKCAKVLGWSPDKVGRYRKIALLSEEAQSCARNLDLDDTEQALFGAAKCETSDDQVKFLQNYRGKDSRLDGDSASPDKGASEEVLIAQLRPWPHAALRYSKKNVRQHTWMIEEFGFVEPVIIDGENRILRGHPRVEAAKGLGMERVPCVRKTNMSEAEMRAYVLAAHKNSCDTTWDEERLAEELEWISSPNSGVNVGITGFSIAEVDDLCERQNREEPGNPEDEKIPANCRRRCQPGDVWQLGSHRLICADSRDRRVVVRLMNGEKAQMAFTDPPYNLPIYGHVGGKGAIKHREFAMACGEMTRSEFTAFLRDIFRNLVEFSIDGSIHFICMDWRHMQEILAAGDIYAELKNLIAWVKDSGGMGSFYRSRHELIFVFKNGTAPHFNSFELGQYGRYRTNVWEYAAASTKEYRDHPTPKPVRMIVDAIKDVSERNGIVLDLFGGSGSTLIAAHKTGRRAYLCECDPEYCDVIIQRWEDHAKDEAKLVYREGQDVDHLAAE